MASGPPTDRCRGVWLVFFMLGLGTLLPWNFFMTATQYFRSRLKEPQAANGTAEGAEPSGELEGRFNNVMTLCAMTPLLVCTCISSMLLTRVPQRVRVIGSLLSILLMFLFTAVLVRVPLRPLAFFYVTLVTVVIINACGAVLQGSLFGMAGLLPPSYTAAVMSGQGLAGTFAALAMICAIASGSELNDAAFGYFITACVVIVLSVLAYSLLPTLEFFQYFQAKNNKEKQEEEQQHQLVDEAGRQEAGSVKQEVPESAGPPGISAVSVLQKVWPLALSVCSTFTITIGLFPAVAADTRSAAPGAGGPGSWESFFTPVTCFLLFNLGDWGGRSLSGVCTWPGADGAKLPALVAARLLFVPLFLLCNVHPRRRMPVVFGHDGWFAAFMLLFAFSGGYLAGLCMRFGPRKVSRHQAETAGAVMAFFLSLGLALGAAVSFAFRALV